MKKRAFALPAIAGLLILCFLIASPGHAARTDDLHGLEGRWVRPDGGYVLELRDIRKNGNLKAAYFNPKPINVARARAEIRNGKITLLVELRDVNYPGSLYRLKYDPAADTLKGTYFQAVEKQKFHIEFFRMNAK
ncbi:MAG TPA: hypothetical protein PLR60_13365 [Syntrophorhabdaceae bacterium]|nr:hypothetical protein [Syntrophorhabdaceae bacterium]